MMNDTTVCVCWAADEILIMQSHAKSCGCLHVCYQTGGYIK